MNSKEARYHSLDQFDDTSSEMSSSTTEFEVRPAVRRRSSRNSLRRCAVYNSTLANAAALLVKDEEVNEDVAIAGLADLNMATPRRHSTRRSAVYNSVVTKAAALCVQEEEDDEEEEISDEVQDEISNKRNKTNYDGVAQSTSRRRQRSENARDTPDFCIKRPRRVSNESPVSNFHA